MVNDRPPRNIRIQINLLTEGADAGDRRPTKGEFQYTRALARVMTGDTITWWSNDGPFALSFQHGSPFKKMLIVSHRDDREEGIHQTGPLEVEKRHAPDRYYYTVALCRIDPKNPQNSEVFMDSCPAVLDEC